MSKPAVFALVDSETQANAAILALETAGFTRSDISILSKDSSSNILVENDLLGSSSFAAPLDSAVPGTDFPTREVGHANSTKAPEGATTGAVTGGLLGGLAGWLVGIGALAIPGVGPFVAAGPILAALSGAAIGATAAGLVGALVGYGIPEYEAKLYAGQLETGNILIGVHALTATEAASAKKALLSVEAHDVRVTSEVAA